MGFSGWVLYSGGTHDGRTLWTTADPEGLVIRRDVFPPETYRIDFALGGTESRETHVVAVYTGHAD